MDKNDAEGADRFPDPSPRGRSGSGTGRVTALLVSPGPVFLVPSSTPFLNSLLACPRDRASLGSRVLPKRRRTTARTMRSSVASEVHGASPFEGITPGYLSSGVIARSRRAPATQFEVVDGGDRERDRTRRRPSGSRRRAPAQPAACSRTCSTVPTRRPSRHCVEGRRASSTPGGLMARRRSKRRSRSARPRRRARRGRATGSPSRDRGRPPRTRCSSTSRRSR